MENGEKGIEDMEGQYRVQGFLLMLFYNRHLN